MAGKQITDDGLSSNLAGMSKNQLYDIMSQMKKLIEQNQQQAKQILIQNPLLTKALFQAQIMLGMVKPPQVIPSIEPPASQLSQQQPLPPQQSSTQLSHSLPGQVGLQDPISASQTQLPARKQHQNQPAMSSSLAFAPTVNPHSQPMTSHPPVKAQQPMGHMNLQVNPMSLPQSSQLQNISQLPHNSAPKPPAPHQPQMPNAFNHMQQPLQTTGNSHMPLQPPLPMQPRPPFHHQYPPQLGPNVGFQHSNAQHLSQSIYHPGGKPPPATGPSFSQGYQGQAQVPSQPPSQSQYQAAGSHFGTEFNNQGGSSMQIDRASWMTGQSENQTVTQFQGPPLVPGQIGPGNQPPHGGAPLSAEMEKALLQQVMSLTPEQINLLPPEQRNQVLQLQKMLCQ